MSSCETHRLAAVTRWVSLRSTHPTGWFDEVKKARWSSAGDVRRSYATASIVSADRIVFNIKGNDYRLVVAADFEKGIVWIK